jgi:exodeoxyribonuclease VII large subunit
VVVADCKVQGEGAPASIVAALERAGRRPGIDAVIVTRGGGSAQDLMAFNDEAVARALAACPVPVITAVGHEVDVTVADLVADLRAATPSEAAERAVPTRADVADRLRWSIERGRRALRVRLVSESRALERLHGRLPSPDGLLGPPRQDLDEALERGRRALDGALERRRRRLEELRRARTRVVDITLPLAVLDISQLESLRGLLRAHQGQMPVRFRLQWEETDGLMVVPNGRFKINPSDAFLAAFEKLPFAKSLRFAEK